MDDPDLTIAKLKTDANPKAVFSGQTKIGQGSVPLPLVVTFSTSLLSTCLFLLFLLISTTGPMPLCIKRMTRGTTTRWPSR